MEIENLTTKNVNQNNYHKNILTKERIGTLLIYPTDYTPDDCLSCDGYILSIEDYEELYAVIGTSFNDGTEEDDEFRIPDYNVTGRFLQPGTDVTAQIEAGLPTHTHTVTMNRTDKSGNDTDCVWSYAENRNGASTVTSSAPSDSIYGNSDTVQPPAQIVHICIKYK